MSETKYPELPPQYTSDDTSAQDFESPSDLVIGIDFGTTFTGVAYAHTGSLSTSTPGTSSMRQIAEKVVVVKSPAISSRLLRRKDSHGIGL